jgi:hypothetical protein
VTVGFIPTGAGPADALGRSVASTPSTMTFMCARLITSFSFGSYLTFVVGGAAARPGRLLHFIRAIENYRELWSKARSGESRNIRVRGPTAE